MNNRYSIVIVLLAILSLVTSCLGDRESDVTYYDDAAVATFSLGTLKRVVHLTSKSGTDSVVVKDLACNSYAFSIDQKKGLIYNIDSLPSGTNVAKSIVTITTKNGGTTFLKSLTSDSMTIITSTDSLDFSQPRTIYVLANDLSWKKEYTVDVRVHNEEADQLYWTRKNDCSLIAPLEDMRALCHAGSMYVYGTVNGTAKMYATAISDGNNWKEVSLPSNKISSVISDGSMLYAADDENVYRTSDLANWNLALGADDDIAQLVAATHSELYALSNDGMIVVSTDKGVTWNYDQIDGDKVYLPSQKVYGVTKTLESNPEIQKVMLVGNRGVEGDKTAMVWTKVVDNGYVVSMPWAHQSFDESSWHPAPLFANMSVTNYGQGILMMGTSLTNTVANTQDGKNFALYYTVDDGLNWTVDSRFALTMGMTTGSDSFAVAADNANHFWVFCGSTGEVWRAHFSSWTWE